MTNREYGNGAAPEASAGSAQLMLKLYVAGQSPKSLLAFANLLTICDTHVKGRYFLDVIDLLDNPHLAKDDQIFAIPTLVRYRPEPVTKIIGDLSNTARVLAGLNLPALVLVKSGSATTGPRK